MAKKSVVHREIDHDKLRWERYLEDHHFPLKRKFPCNELRKVVVKIDQWPGNPHHHVDIKEEENPVWDEEKSDWYNTYYDSNGRGAQFSVKFWKKANAEAFIKLIWKDWFKPETHRLVCTLFDFTEQKTPLQRKFDKWTGKAGD